MAEKSKIVLSAAADEIDRLRAEIAALKDPSRVLVNMMRGHIATPSPAALADLFGANLTDIDAANLRIAELSEALQFVERWAVHHAGKRYHDGSPIHRAEDVLRTIAAHPSISEITKRMEGP